MTKCDGCLKTITTGRKDGKPQLTDLALAFNPPAGLELPATHLCMECAAVLYGSWVETVCATRSALKMDAQAEGA